MDVQHSGTLVAWVVVRVDPNEDDEMVDLLEVDAGRIPASPQHRSAYDWFMEDHWPQGERCFWDEQDRPAPGEYLVTFHIEGGWSNTTNDRDYDEQLVVEKVARVDLGGIR